MPSVRAASIGNLSQMIRLVVAMFIVLCVWQLMGIPSPDEVGTRMTTITAKAIFKNFDIENGEFVMFRAIGNDLPPRHAPGQTLNNIRFILENEADLPGLSKEWVVNRVVNTTERKAIIALLEQHNQVYTDIEVDLRKYSQIQTDWANVDFNWQDITRYTPMEQNPVFPDRALWRASAIDHVLAKKNRYIINNNGARNAMLKIGISKGYRWILPFDGNCFLTPAAWKDMTETVMKNTNEKYFYVPMERMQDNAALFDPNFKAEALEEPQLIFRSDAIERFDESLTRYGRRPKVDMLYRLGIPGVWDAQLTKSKPYYETYNFTLSYDIQAKGSVKRASWVARLFSGSAAQEVTSVNSASLRKYNRCVGVARILNWANAIAAEKLYGYSQTVMLAFDYHILNAERASYSAGDKPVATVVEVVKSDAVNWLQESDGFWYRKFDDNTEPIVVSANNYDSANENPASHESRFAKFFNAVTSLTLAGFFTGEDKFSLAAVKILEQFFETKYKPKDLVLAMYGDEKNVEDLHTYETFVLGAIEFKDWYYVLDMVRLLHRDGFLPLRLYRIIQAWMAEYLTLVRAIAETEYIPVHGFEYAAKGARGVWYDVQMASIASFIGDGTLTFDFVEKTKPRLLRQFGSLKSPRKAEYPGNAVVVSPSWKEDNIEAVTGYTDSLYILHGYVAMATIAEKMGVDLWNYGRNDDHIMLNSVYFHLTGEGMPDMILKDKNSRRLSSDALNGFASDIATPRPGTTSLVHVARLQYPDVRLDSDNMAAEGRPAMRSLYLEDLPVEGSDDVNVVRPYWMLGLGKNI